MSVKGGGMFPSPPQWNNGQFTDNLSYLMAKVHFFRGYWQITPSKFNWKHCLAGICVKPKEIG